MEEQKETEQQEANQQGQEPKYDPAVVAQWKKEIEAGYREPITLARRVLVITVFLEKLIPELKAMGRRSEIISKLKEIQKTHIGFIEIATAVYGKEIYTMNADTILETPEEEEKKEFPPLSLVPEETQEPIETK